MDRHNSEIMNRYIADQENLKLMMNLLKSKEKQIAFETFHCFKVRFHTCRFWPRLVVKHLLAMLKSNSRQHMSLD